MRLASLWLFSALAARAGADAAAAADVDPSRWSLRALTGGRYDAAAAAQPADASSTRNVTNVCCPISMELMECPVMAADGNTYDRSSIEDWFSRGKQTSPLTGAPLAHLGLTPNNLVRSMVSEYRDASSRRA